MDDCIFCKIINDEIPSFTLYEDDIAKVILDRFPSNIGHALVISKKHYRNIIDVDEETYAHMMKLASRYAKALYNECEGINILQNNEEVSGQTVFHLHIHIIPRYKNDSVKILWENKDPSLEEFEGIKNRFSKETIWD